MLSNALRVGSRGVNDLDASRRGRLDVDLVIADAMPAHDLEVLAPIEERGIDHAARADDQRISSHNLALEGGRIQRTGHAELPRVAEEPQARFVHAGQGEDDWTAFHGGSRWLSLSDENGRRIIHR